MASAEVYDAIGRDYAGTRRTDPRIVAAIWGALGEARTVLNVGAGAGSYEPPDRDGFYGAFWRRPVAYLEPEVRARISVFARLGADELDRRLRDDLRTDAWEIRHADLLQLDALELGYRVVVAELCPPVAGWAVVTLWSHHGATPMVDPAAWVQPSAQLIGEVRVGPCVVGHAVHLEGVTLEDAVPVGSSSVVLEGACVRTPPEFWSSERP